LRRRKESGSSQENTSGPAFYVTLQA
jgi:hypothetical protein